MAYQNNNRNKKNFPKNARMSFEMYLGGISGNQQYDVESLIEFMKDIPFNKISIPVMAPKSVVFNDMTKRGTVQVGYISNISYEDEDVVFKTVIFAKNSEAIKNMEVPIIYPKVRVNDNGDIQVITSFELNEAPCEDESE